MTEPMASQATGLLLVGGHALMAVCAACYLAWWVIFFRPGIPKVTGALYSAGVVCIILTAIAGLAGAAMIGVGTARTSVPGVSPSGWWFALGAVALYALLAFVTSRLFGRPITTELLLFVAWAAVELACIITLGSAGGLSQAATIILTILVILAFAGMLITYLLYYQLAPLPSFIDGAIPLAAVGVLSVVLAACFGKFL